MDNKTLMDVTRDSYDRMARSYNATMDADWFSTQYGYHICRRFARQLPEGEGNLLIVGSAGGRVACYAAKNSDKYVVGVDFSEEMVRISEERKTEQGLTNCEFIAANILDMDFEEQFQGIACDGMLYHIPSELLPALLEKFHSWLTQDGIFYATFKRGHGSEFQQNHHKFKGARRAYWYHTRPELVDLFSQAKFDVKVERPLVAIFGDRYFYNVWAKKRTDSA